MNQRVDQIVLSLVALVCIALPTSAWTQDSHVIEEVLVLSVNGCGSWPIDHGDIATCEYAVLAQEIVSKVRESRVGAAPSCIVCENEQCRRQSFTLEQRSQSDWCKKLFWTPRRIDKLRLTNEEAPGLEVSFTYEISKEGRVDNVQITHLHSDWSEQEVQRNLEAGAKGVRYLPLTINGVQYRIVNLDASYNLEGGVW